MEGKKKVVLTLVVLVLAAMVLYFSAMAVTKFTGYVVSQKLGNENFAKCLGEKSVLYVKAGCPHCAQQEEMFGDFVARLNVIDCAITPEKCTDAGIEYIPTWEINGKIQPSGVKSLKELAEISECKL